MSRLTVRLPQSLHDQLTELAEREGVSLNQYIVYALSRQAALAYTVQPVSDRAIQEQKVAYRALLQSLGKASFSEIKEALSERDPVESETGLTPEVVARLRARTKIEV